MRSLLLLALALVAVAAAPNNSQDRILGGAVATISQYPQMAALLYTANLSTYSITCSGIIINSRSILTAAQCPSGHTVDRWRARVGTALAASGGTLHELLSIIIHSSYAAATKNNDIAILRTQTEIRAVVNAVQFASIAGPTYIVPDEQVVWAPGWGRTTATGANSNTLNHVQIWTINQFMCAYRYSDLGLTVTNNMMCAGWLDVGGRDTCGGDEGSPLLHNNIVIGVASWRQSCGLARYPSVFTRISRYTDWIQANA